MDIRRANPTIKVLLALGLGLGLPLLLVSTFTVPVGAAHARAGVAEHQPAPANSPGTPTAVITVTSTLDDLTANGNCTLREAIQAANTDAPVDACPAGNGADVIVLLYSSYSLSLPGSGEDNNATGDLDISNSLSIVSNNPASYRNIRADGLDRVLHVTTGGITVTLSGIGLLDGDVSGQGGGI